MTGNIIAAARNSFGAYLIYAIILAFLAWGLLREHERRVNQRALIRHAEELNAVNEALQKEVVDRKASETRAKQETERTRRYFDVADLVLITLDDRQHIRQINRKGSELLGVSQSAIEGRDWLEFIPAASRKKASSRIRRALKGKSGGNGADAEFPLLGLDGQEHVIGWRFALLESEGHEPRQARATGTDGHVLPPTDLGVPATC